MALPEEKYTTDAYLLSNPSWDIEDSPWKAAAAAGLLKTCGVTPESVCEIGCGAGRVLLELKKYYPGAEFCGYEIAPAAARFWETCADKSIRFILGDFLKHNKAHYDLILLLDVMEHLGDPFTFLNGLHGSADYYLFHVPLDLNALAVLREVPLLTQRKEVGHLHYFTKNLALELLRECGFEVIAWTYTGAYLNTPRKTWKTRVAALPRLLACAINKDWGVRLLGGETVLVLARSAVK
ncbi:MAG: class I SAM-dependent methyltransferase [Elusimicrobiota bacterium]|nr:class I SAM-dependent methyltransferase [Elusimicrobiota bacterium]